MDREERDIRAGGEKVVANPVGHGRRRDTLRVTPSGRGDSWRTTILDDEQSLCLELGVSIRNNAARNAERACQRARARQLDPTAQGTAHDLAAKRSFQGSPQGLPSLWFKRPPTGLIDHRLRGSCHKASASATLGTCSVRPL